VDEISRKVYKDTSPYLSMEKNLKVSDETHKRVMIIKIEEGYSSVDKIIKEMLDRRKK